MTIFDAKAVVATHSISRTRVEQICRRFLAKITLEAFVAIQKYGQEVWELVGELTEHGEAPTPAGLHLEERGARLSRLAHAPGISSVLVPRQGWASRFAPPAIVSKRPEVRKRLDWARLALGRAHDVRDVAELHVRVMTAPGASGQRYICAGPFIWFSGIADILRTQMPSVAAKVPKRALPDWLVRFSALFDPALRERIYELGKFRPVSADKALRELGWAPRPNAEAIVATARSLADQGLISAK